LRSFNIWVNIFLLCHIYFMPANILIFVKKCYKKVKKASVSIPNKPDWFSAKKR